MAKSKKEKKADKGPKDIMVEVYGPNTGSERVTQPILGTYVRGKGTLLAATNKAGEVTCMTWMPEVKLKKRKEVYLLTPEESDDKKAEKAAKRAEKKGKKGKK